jgi:hypothetical protein
VTGARGSRAHPGKGGPHAHTIKRLCAAAVAEPVLLLLLLVLL